MDHSLLSAAARGEAGSDAWQITMPAAHMLLAASRTVMDFGYFFTVEFGRKIKQQLQAGKSSLCEFPFMPDWHVYLVRTRYGALYTGIATDVRRRLAEHEDGGKKAARCLRSKGPLQLAYSAKIGSRALALKAEGCIKKLTKREKEAIVVEKLTGKALLRLLSL